MRSNSDRRAARRQQQVKVDDEIGGTSRKLATFQIGNSERIISKNFFEPTYPFETNLTVRDYRIKSSYSHGLCNDLKKNVNFNIRKPFDFDYRSVACFVQLPETPNFRERL